MTALTVNTYYNFSVHANAILGTNYKNARLLSVMDYKMALKFSNVVLLHKQIYPYLPAGIPFDQTKYVYYCFDVNGKAVVLADVWLITDSVEQASTRSTTITLRNATTAEVGVVRDQLRLLGISFEITN